MFLFLLEINKEVDILAIMKRVNSITRKILLFAMLLFIMHDFVIGQSDIIANTQETLKSCQAPNTPALTVGEHHIFHAPFLLNNEDICIEKKSMQKNLYTLNILKNQEFTTPLYTPPKFI